MRRDIDRGLVELGGRRAGAFPRHEATPLGASAELLARRVSSGLLVAHPGDVFTLAASPTCLDQRRWVGLLAAGPRAHLSHESAGELRGVQSVRRGLVVITVDAPVHLRIPGVTFHQLADVAPDDLTVVGGFPTTTAARTVVDLAAVLSHVRLRLAIEHLVVDRQASFGQIGVVLRRVRRRGKPGVRKLVATLDSLDGVPPPATKLERLLYAAGTRAGVLVVRQFALPWDRVPVEGVVDGAVLESKLILESDGRSWHTRMKDQAKDARRDREAARCGWQTLRFVWEDLNNDLESAADDIRATHDLRSQGSRP